VLNVDKAACATIAKQFDRDYWDGERKYGYGGYSYDGRWYPLAEEVGNYYGVKPGDKILDIGCGKGYLLFEFTQAFPGVDIVGLDISDYAIENSKQEVKKHLQIGDAVKLPFEDNEFDLVVSINTLHNLMIYDLQIALQEIERVGREHKYIVVDSYRTESEKVNLLYWQLTCECFYTPAEWEWIFQVSQYTGDYGCIYYE